MTDSIKWVANRMPKSDDRQLSIMSLGNVAKARFFHSSFPQYSITPLARLDGMAKYLGLGGLFVKDESFRFGLNAFKVLGGSFAMARYIAKEMGRDVSEMTYDYLTSEAFRQEFGHATFFTATDGNHGRGVAWAAHKLGQKAVVHMPKGSSQARYENIAKEGAQVTIEEVNYDDCVRMAAGTSPDYPPYEFYSDAAMTQFAGIDVEVAKFIADSMGMELQMEAMNFDNLVTSLGNGDFDMVLAACEYSEERALACDFSDPYYTDLPPVILVKTANLDKYKTLDDINKAGVIIGAQKNTTKANAAADMFPEAANGMVLESLVPTLITELKNGTIDLLVLDGNVGMSYIK